MTAKFAFEATLSTKTSGDLTPAVYVYTLTFVVLFSGLLKLSSKGREDRVSRADFLWEAGSSDRNSELVSNSIDLRFGVVATDSAPTVPLLRSITILTPN